MNKNEELVNLRKKCNLTLREASKLCSLNYLTLKNMEEGYLKSKGKREKKAIEGYNLRSKILTEEINPDSTSSSIIPDDYFNDPLDKGYITSFSEVSNKEKKLIKKVSKAYQSIYFYIINILVLIASVLTVVFTSFKINDYTSDPLGSYSASYQEVYKEISTTGDDEILLTYVLYDIHGKSLTFSSNSNETTSFIICNNLKYPHILFS